MINQINVKVIKDKCFVKHLKLRLVVVVLIQALQELVKK